MPLILAVESDRRQASQVTAVVRERLGADLVIADTAEKALEALGNRVPDLILTSMLLSAKDETALSDRLRSLDVAAAHVQTLTIPMFGTTRPRSSGGRGMLSALLGDRHASAAHDGCDPALFADQCKEYLKRAAAERASQESPAIAAVEQEAVVWAEPSAEKVVGAPLPEPVSEPQTEIDLSALLDERVVEQLTAAIEAVSLQKSGVAPVESALQASLTEMAAIAHPPMPPASEPSTSPSAITRMWHPSHKPAAAVHSTLLYPSHGGFSALLAKLDEITHVASPLPCRDPLAGSFDVNR